MQGNVLGQVGGSGSSGLNVFAQLAEPSKKDGIWIKTPENKYKFEKVEITNLFPFESSALTAIPTKYKEGAIVAANNKIYIFGGGTSQNLDYSKYACLYNPEEDMYTQLPDIPTYFLKNEPAVAVNNKIYLFCGSHADVCDFDTIKNDYISFNVSIPKNFEESSAVAVEDDIYLFGGSSNSNKAYKYNTKTKTFTEIANLPDYLKNGTVTVLNNEIYLFFKMKSTTKGKYFYKYNLKTNSYEELSSISIEFMTTINNKIYVISNKILYEYNATEHTFTEVVKSFTPYSNLGAVLGNEVYFLHASVKYSFLEIGNKLILIKAFNKYKTKLTDNMEINFNQAKIYDNNTLKENYLTFYGDGEKWNIIGDWTIEKTETATILKTHIEELPELSTSAPADALCGKELEIKNYDNEDMILVNRNTPTYTATLKGNDKEIMQNFIDSFGISENGAKIYFDTKLESGTWITTGYIEIILPANANI